jgi:lysophospholipase L1-like esterase
MKKNFLLGFFSLFTALLIAEAGFQFIYFLRPRPMSPAISTEWVILPEDAWTRRHSTLGWFHEAEKRSMLKKEAAEIQTEINTNSNGFRGSRNYQLASSAGNVRIVALGDSFTFGWGVHDQETFAAVIENLQSNAEVINLGSAGFGLDQTLLSFREIGSKFNPDYVVISIYPEMFWRSTRAYTDAGYGKPYFVLGHGNVLELKNVPVKGPEELGYHQYPEQFSSNHFSYLLSRSALFRYLKHKILRFFRDLGWIDPDLTDEWKISRILLKKLVEEIRAEGAQAILLLVPPVQWMEHSKKTSIQKSLFRFSKKENVRLIDLTEILKPMAEKHGLDTYYIKNDGHWTKTSHALVASILLDQINTTMT